MFSFKKHDLPVFEVEMEDGSFLHVKSPTKKTADLLISVFESGCDTETIVKAAAIFLSDNTEGVKYNPDDLVAVPVVALTDFIFGYYQFVTDSISKKN